MLDVVPYRHGCRAEVTVGGFVLFACIYIGPKAPSPEYLIRKYKLGGSTEMLYAVLEESNVSVDEFHEPSSRHEKVLVRIIILFEN